MNTLADQLASEWAAVDPSATATCIQCGKPFPVSHWVTSRT